MAEQQADMQTKCYLVVLQRILHGERLDELFRADKAQSVLKAERKHSLRLMTEHN